MRQLLDKNKKAWVREVHPGIDPDEAHFVRGFVDEWDGSVDDYAEFGETVHSRTPLSTLAPTVVPQRGDIEQLAGVPCLSRLRNLCLGYSELDDADLAPLFSSPYLGSLRYLGLEANEFTGRTITRLTESTSLPNLRSLNLDSVNLTPQSVEKLAKAPLMGQLEVLDLSWCPIGNKGVRALARSDYLGKLRELLLFRVGCNDKAIWALLDNASLENLEELQLFDNDIGLFGVRAIARASHRFEFRDLGIGQCRLDATALDVLLTARLTALTSLGLSNNPFGDEALARFLAAVELPEQTGFNLSETGASTRTIDVLLDRFPERLDGLSLDGNPLDDEALVRLVESPAVTNMRGLRLGHGHFDKTVRMTDQTARALLGSPYLDNILGLELRGGQFSDTMKSELQKRFGDRVEFS